MEGPLLETKLRVPRQRRSLVARPRLGERVGRAAESALTVVSAPAGFGKTTLLTNWVAQWLAAGPTDGRSAAWLSLDERDNDPALFWSYLIAALQTGVPGLGRTALSLLHAPRPPIEEVLAALLNDLDNIPHEVLLVLDDYHLIDARELHDGMAFLVEHLPRQIHLVLAGRADPALPLARLRVRGELVEIRAADLRFTPDETAAYLNEVMGLALTDPDVAALGGRTEGWIAALQLAALSLQDRADATEFIAGFAGDDRYIVDYLAEEVLQRQPEEVHRFLLQTSVLDRLTGPLCDAVTGQHGGKATLAALERANLFLIPLDDHRRWYRYHHLFADVLRAHLHDEQPDHVPDLHRRASSWFERNHEPPEAISHALAGADYERAANLVELAIPTTRQHRQETTLRRWLEALPDELIRVRPVLSNGYAGSLLVRGEVKGVEARLRDAERWLDTVPGSQPADPAQAVARSPQMVVADQAAFRTLPAAIAVHRAGQARMLGDLVGTMAHARRALDLVGEDDHLGHGAAAALLGLASWTNGDLEGAHRWYTDAQASMEKAGHLSDVVGCAITLADLRIAQGRLRDAMTTYEQALRIATEHAPPLRGAADMHVGMSVLLRERNELGVAWEHLLVNSELGEHAGLPQNRYRGRVAMARIREAQGDLSGALDLINQAEGVYNTDFSPDVRPIPAVRARLWVLMGLVDEAVGWASWRGLSPEDELSYLREFEHITLTRVLLARSRRDNTGDSHEPTRLLERLLRAAEAGARTGSVIEILVLQAMAHQAHGDLPAALGSLQRALTLSEQEGYVRMFVDEGPSMAALLRAVSKQRVPLSYVRRLLAAFDVSDSAGGGTHTQPGMIEPLSERELDVLRLLATDLDGPDIARRLIVSLSTVRTHTKHIYAKLGVNNRRAAVSRAQELQLISRVRDR